MRLRGARLAVATEPEKGARLSASQVKRLASRDRMTGRDLHKSQVEWDPTHTLLVATNHELVLSDTSGPSQRRVALVPFPVRFRQGGDNRDGPMEDPRLAAPLFAEAEGILAWVVRGSIAHIARGTLFPLPKASSERTQQYLDEADRFGEWMRKRVIHDPTPTARPTRVFWHDYSAWCLANDAAHRPQGRSQGVRHGVLQARPSPSFRVRDKTVDGTKHWVGMCLAADDDEPGQRRSLGRSARSRRA